MGGYFFVYVIFSLLLFATLVRRNRARQGRVAGGFFVLLSVLTSVMPQSHELRYYMYWIIVLITLNFYLLVHARGDTEDGVWCAASRHHLVCHADYDGRLDEGGLYSSDNPSR